MADAKTDDSMVNLAFELKTSGRTEEAIEAFKAAADHGQHEGVACMMAAALYYYELGDSRNAIPWARRAVRLQPASEHSSICLAHCLFDQGRHDEMNEEIRRYLATGAELDFYVTLFEENGLSAEEFL